MSKPTIPDELGEILKPLSDGGYHNNSDDKTRSTCYDCKRIDQARTKLTKLISKREIEARKKELKRFLEYEVLTHQGGLQRARSVSVKKIENRLNTLTELQEGKE